MLEFGIHHGDAYDELKRLCSDSLDAVITDPPYGTTQMEWDTAAQWDRLWPLLKDVIRPNAVVVSFSAPPYHADLINSNLDWWRYEIIWAKTKGTRFLDANDRPLQGHENIQVFTESIRESTYNPQKWDAGYGYKTTTNGENHYNDTSGNFVAESSGERHPLTILQYSNGVSGESHPSQKPLDLMRWLVRSYTNEGDHVLDPFCGAGTTGLVALAKGRDFTGIDLNREYVEMAAERIRKDAPLCNRVRLERGAGEAF